MDRGGPIANRTGHRTFLSGQERTREVETRVHVTDYNSDDDMNDILGVDDNDDEKKSAVEPYTGRVSN